MPPDNLVGQLPDGWTLTTLGEMCRATGGNIQTGPFGSQLHASDYVEVGIPSIMPQNIGDNRISLDGIARISMADAERLNRYLVRPGDIIYSRRGDVERRALIRSQEDGWLCGTGCLRVRFGDESKINPVFVSYYLGHPNVREWIVRHAVGATMPNLNTSILSALPFVMPPIKEQRQIASVLGALDDKIELNRRMNETLEAMARAIFQSWFVNFDPVRAKAEGRQPWGIDAKTADIFPDEFQKNGLPKGWESRRLGDVVELSYGKALKAENRQAGHIPVFGSNGAVGFHNEALVKGPGIVVGRKGNPGIVTLSQSDFFPIDTTFYVVPKMAIFSVYHLYYMLDYLGLPALSADSAVPGLNRNIAYMTEVVWPDIAVIDAFNRYVEPLFKLYFSNQQQAITLVDLRDTLLPKLMSGEVHVKQAEKEIEEAIACV